MRRETREQHSARRWATVLTCTCVGVGGAVLAVACTFPEINIVAAECVDDASCPDLRDPCVENRCIAEQCVAEPRDPHLCSTPADPCKQSRCEENLCVEVAAVNGNPCGDDGDFCHEGSCVECTATMGCVSPLFCSDHYCISPDCVGCGGVNCLPCEMGDPCTEASECGNLGCVDDACADCTNDSHCGDRFCCLEGEQCGTEGSCYEKRANGVSCTVGTQCATGNCVDGVCCNVRCDETCMACNALNTGGDDGVCANAAKCTKDSACMGLDRCNGNGACQGLGALNCVLQ